MTAQQESRVDVATTTSADGTTLAYEAFGTGPVVVVVGGAWCDRGSFRDLAQALGDQGLTGVTYDRRGRGDSTNTSPYAVQREVEDLTAVIEAARQQDGPAYAHGISSGGALVVEAVAAGAPVTRASVLETPYRTPGWPAAPDDYVATLERLEAAGDHYGIMHLFHTKVVGMPEEMLDDMRGTPMLDAMLAIAPTVRHDALCLGGDDQSLPVQTLARVTVPVLAVCSNGTQMPWLHDSAAVLAAALPDGTQVELEGGFHEVPATTLAPVLKTFYTS